MFFNQLSRLVLLLVLAQTLVAQTLFRTPKNYDTTGPALSMALGDLNGDGKLDVVVSGSSSNGPEIVMLLGNGDGSFQPAQDTVRMSDDVVEF